MFPADYLRYCSSESDLQGAFNGLTYTTSVITTNDEGVNGLSTGVVDGLVGRLPCKLFEALPDNTKFNSVFAGLGFCAFVNFNSYKFNHGYPASQCRGIKYPPDLLKNNPNLLSIEGLF